MAIEKRWEAIAPRLFTSNGGTEGQITLTSTIGFKVKQQVILKATSQSGALLEIKRVVSKTLLLVGKPGPINDRSDISTYLVADGASIESLEQPRPNIHIQEHENAVYAEEPIVAKRSILVDELGNYYNSSNPLPIKIDYSESDSTVKNTFGEIASLATNTQTTIASYTAPLDKESFLERIEVSGTNIAEYEVFINASKTAKKRTHFGADLSTSFDFASPIGRGIPLTPGDVVTIKVKHPRPDVGDFEARIQTLEVFF